MRFAFTIGCYRLKNFCELNVAAIRRAFGPDTPILISDDRSSESSDIESSAMSMRVSYCCTKHKLAHFCGDVQSLINSISFAHACDADVAVKISQRLIILSPEIRNIAEGYFNDSAVDIALPGRPPSNSIIGAPGFHHYPFLTDVMFIRTKAFDAAKMKERYEARLKSGSYYNSFVEFLINDLVMSELKDKHRVFNALTAHSGPPHLYLRRYQNRPDEYLRAAVELGIGARQFETAEWGAMEGAAYDPRPRVR